MTEKIIYYIKEGSRYKPVHEYDQGLMDSFPKGSHLVICYLNGQSTRYNIDPAYAPMIAAGRVAEDKISEAIRKASDMRPKRAPLTEGQQQAWENLVKEFGEDARMLEWPSAREVAEEAVKAMAVEADKLLEHPAVRKAYDHFMLMCQLTKESKKNEQA
jgi:hypothetical protein